MQAAEERLRLARIGWVRFLGLLDATSGLDGHKFGPAFRVTLPIFNRNQGGIARAEAECEQLDRRRGTLRNQIVTDVRLAATRFQQAEAELKTLTKEVRPAGGSGDRPSRKGVSSRQRVVSARARIDTATVRLRYFREAQLNADRQRAWADLERSVGRRLGEVQP